MQSIKSAYKCFRWLMEDKNIPMVDLFMHLQESPADPTGTVPKYNRYLDKAGNLQPTPQHRGRYQNQTQSV